MSTVKCQSFHFRGLCCWKKQSASNNEIFWRGGKNPCGMINVTNSRVVFWDMYYNVCFMCEIWTLWLVNREHEIAWPLQFQIVCAKLTLQRFCISCMATFDFFKTPKQMKALVKVKWLLTEYTILRKFCIFKKMFSNLLNLWPTHSNFCKKQHYLLQNSRKWIFYFRFELKIECWFRGWWLKVYQVCHGCLSQFEVCNQTVWTDFPIN